MIVFRNEECSKTMKYMYKKDIKVDIVLTSPPYNASRKVRTDSEIKERRSKYKYYDDCKPFEEYCYFIVKTLKQCEKILKQNGVILLNLSYISSIELGMIGSNLILLMNDILNKTEFELADIICWKKKSALPNNRSSNKCTRICEFVFVLCRKEEYMTFVSNKQITSVHDDLGTKYYTNMFNFIEAKNNDGKNPYNNATFSVDFVSQLLNMYCMDGMTVYDPFGGIGTTAIACYMENRNISCVCSEIDTEQVEYAKNRLERIKKDG